jgi:thiamine pyrophosphate-dependent acetolactate synthase large subunit-like protein
MKHKAVRKAVRKFAETDADFIIAVNKNPNATMMKMADVAVVADASQVCSALIKGLKQRIQAKSDYLYTAS